ncbi:MAG: hypothetical protein AABW85_02715, partial [archaeon]
MKPDKQVKAEFRQIASKEPQKHYPVEPLKALGFSRAQCTDCKKFFWSIAASTVCGDPACSGGYRFVGDSLQKNSLITWVHGRLFGTFSKNAATLSTRL